MFKRRKQPRIDQCAPSPRRCESDFLQAVDNDEFSKVAEKIIALGSEAVQCVGIGCSAKRVAERCGYPTDGSNQDNIAELAKRVVSTVKIRKL